MTTTICQNGAAKLICDSNKHYKLMHYEYGKWILGHDFGLDGIYAGCMFSQIKYVAIEKEA